MDLAGQSPSKRGVKRRSGGRLRKNDHFVDVFTSIFFHTSPLLFLPAALISFGLIAYLATSTAAKNPNLQSLGPLGSLFAAFIAFLTLVSGALAALQQTKRRALLAKQSSIESVRALSWFQFELLVGEAYRQQGYTVEETGQGGADGGIDLKLRRQGEIALVQCIQWKKWKVGVSAIREFYGVLMAEGNHGIFITTGVFTADARAFAAGKPLELIDGDSLILLIRPTETCVSPSVHPSLPAQTSPSTSPACLKCGSGMALRTARIGAAAGSKFWGCSSYPGCRGTVNA